LLEDLCGGFDVVELKIDTKKRREGESLSILEFIDSESLSTNM